MRVRMQNEQQPGNIFYDILFGSLKNLSKPQKKEVME